MWGLNGSFAIPGAFRIVCIIVVLLVSALLSGMALRFFRAARDLPEAHAQPSSANPFQSRLYSLAVGAQFVAIFAGARVLTALGYPDAIISAVAIIVGLHFFALIPVFRSGRFAAVGGAMIALGLGSLLLAPTAVWEATGEPFALRAAAVGLGCAIILWAAVAPLVLTTWQQLRRAPRANAG